MRHFPALIGSNKVLSPKTYPGANKRKDKFLNGSVGVITVNFNHTESVLGEQNIMIHIYFVNLYWICIGTMRVH